MQAYTPALLYTVPLTREVCCESAGRGVAGILALYDLSLSGANQALISLEMSSSSLSVVWSGVNPEVAQKGREGLEGEGKSRKQPNTR